MPEPLKNAYNQPYIERLAQSIQQIWPMFDGSRFTAMVLDDAWETRELKARMKHITASMGACIPLSFTESVDILLKSAERFGGFEGMFFPDYIEQFGADHWDVSVNALEVLTQYSSSEFAVRPMIIKAPEKMMGTMLAWASHENYHVRRLASEGCRPRLPWAMALPQFKKDPDLILPILEQLKQDESDYVRRSVANNLNDIAKDNPDVVIAWCKARKGQHPHTDWIIKHGCRTLLKQAHPEVMAMFGYRTAASVSVTDLMIQNDKLTMGDDLGFGFCVSSSQGALSKLRIEYIIDYVKANGRCSSKVFKVSESDYRQREISFTRKHSFRQMTTRKHYPGEHALSIRINGEVKKAVKFILH